MVSLTIDGKTVEVEEGTTVLQAAEKLGIRIPTLCHHASLHPYSACRVCLVELNHPREGQLQTETGVVARRLANRVGLQKCRRWSFPRLAPLG